MSLKFSCPSCGAQIEFKSLITVYGVCAACRGSVIRSDEGVKSIGEVAEVPDDLSPLQVGADGTYEGKPFEILGRQKIQWAEGCWNEWYCHFATGRDAWIAEAQGFWGLCFRNDPRQVPNFKSAGIGAEVVIPNEGKFWVDDRKKNICVATEGELPWNDVAGGKERFSIDLVGEKGKFATIEYLADTTRFYVGRFVTLRDLRIRNLRQIEGWPRWIP